MKWISGILSATTVAFSAMQVHGKHQEGIQEKRKLHHRRRRHDKNLHTLKIRQLRYNDVVLANGSTNASDIGTSYIFTEYILEPDNELPLGFVGGQCTRYGSADGENPGFGSCQFTYGDKTGNTVTVNGLLFDGGGVLAVTGGTGEFMRAKGQVSLWPYEEDLITSATGDIFEDVAVYRGELEIVYR